MRKGCRNGKKIEIACTCHPTNGNWVIANGLQQEKQKCVISEQSEEKTNWFLRRVSLALFPLPYSVFMSSSWFHRFGKWQKVRARALFHRVFGILFWQVWTTCHGIWIFYIKLNFCVRAMNNIRHKLYSSSSAVGKITVFFVSRHKNTITKDSVLVPVAL